jgi:hypothetical protein
MFRKVLIANRGEIAVRVQRTLREMGIVSVAVYSDVDHEAPHVTGADEAYLLGGAEPSASYLNQKRILEVAKEAGCDALHPGYGFLSENAVFARACQEAGVTFLGPPAQAIEDMGSKLRSRQLMVQAGVPVVPGSDGFEQGIVALRKVADDMGYPVLLKPRRLLATARCISRSTSGARGTSRSRCSPMITAMSCTCSNVSAASSDGIRRSSRRRHRLPSMPSHARRWDKQQLPRRVPWGTAVPARSSSFSMIPAGSISWK